MWGKKSDGGGEKAGKAANVKNARGSGRKKNQGCPAGRNKKKIERNFMGEDKKDQVLAQGRGGGAKTVPGKKGLDLHAKGARGRTQHLTWEGRGKREVDPR